MTKYPLLLGLLLLLLLPTAAALGVTPAQTIIHYQPGLRQTVTLNIVNNEHKEFQAVLYPQGPLAKYVRIKEAILRIPADQYLTPASYEVSFPSEDLEPGDHETDIVIMQLPDQFLSESENALITDSGTVIFPNKGQALVSATLAVISKLFVKVPFPGTYSRIELSVSAAQPGDAVTFIVSAFNLGQNVIQDGKATIEILGPTNEKIAEVETDQKGIDTRQKREFIASWTAPKNPGSYKAIARFDYDGKQALAERIFTIGSLLLEVIDVTVNDFRLGGIAKFDILTENQWNERIDGAFAQLILRDQNGLLVTDLKSPSLEMAPGTRQVFSVFWDTTGVGEGTYDATILLHYAGRTTERQMKAIVTLDGIRVSVLGTGEAVRAGGGGISLTTLVTVLIVLLIGLNLAWFFYFRRRRP